MKHIVLQKSGGYRECDPGETPTAIFLKSWEYNGLKDLSELNLKIISWRDDVFGASWKEEGLKKEIKALEAQIEILRVEVEQKAAAMHELDDEVSKECNNNDYLLRRAKENANKFRNCHPKKAHPGYIMIRQDEENINTGYDNSGNSSYLRGWKATIETPYHSSIPIELIEEIVKHELSKALIGSVGIFKGRYIDVPEIAREGNVIYNYDFHVNVNDKHHYWMICIHSLHQVEISEGKRDS